MILSVIQTLKTGKNKPFSYTDTESRKNKPFSYTDTENREE